MKICPYCKKEILFISSLDHDKCLYCGEWVYRAETEKVAVSLLERVWYKLPLWLRITISVLTGLIIFAYLPLIGRFLYAYPVMFFIAWLSLPLLLLLVKISRIHNPIKLSYAVKMRVVCLSMSVSLSFLLFGYVSGKEFETSLFENPLNWLISMLFLFSLAAIPVITWKIGRAIIESTDEYIRYKE